MGQYDDLFEPARPNPALAVRLNADANPDQEAEYLKLAKRYKVPTPLVQTFPDEYKARAKADDVDEITRPAPKLRGWLSESTNAKLALDDVSPLTEIEQAVKRYGELKAWNGPEPTAMNVLKGLAKSFPQGFNAMKAGLDVQMADFLESVGLVTPDPIYKADRERKLRQAMGASEFTTPDFESSTARGVYGGVSSLLRQLPGLAATIATRNPTPAMAALGIQTQGEAYGKYRARGATGGEAFVGAGGETLVELATEYLPSKYIADAFGNAPVRDFIVNFLKKEAPGEQAATLLQDAIDTAIANPDKTWAQYLQERPEAAYQTLVATLTQTGLMAGANSIVRSIAESGKGEAAEEDAKQLADLLKTAGSALLRERSPEQFRELMGQMSDGAVIHVDGAVLNQLAPEVLAALPESVRNEIPTAAAIDTTVAIPVADVLTVAPGTPLEQVLVENARMTPDAESQASAKAAAESQANVLMQQAERVMQQAADQEQARNDYETVRSMYAEQLKAAGRYRPAVAETMPHFLASFFTAYGSRLGLTAVEMQARYPVRIAGEPSSAGQTVMSQGKPGEITVEGYHFSKEDRPVISTALFGTGLQGSSREEYLNAADKRLSKRAYFYADKGTGITPESGVGGRAHRAQLTNVYDSNLDPLGLKKGPGGKLGFESRVLDAGFSGYLDRLEGTQPGQVIMLGDQLIQPEILGPQSRIETGKRVPAMPVTEPQWTSYATGTPAEMQAQLERMQAKSSWQAYDMRVEGGTLQYRKKAAVLNQADAKVNNLTSVAERGERAMGTRAMFSPEEKQAVKDSAEKIGVSEKEITDTVRGHKLAHPTVQGWAPLTFVRAEIDKGKVVYVYRPTPYSFSSDKAGKQIEVGTPAYTKRVTAVAKAMTEEVRRVFKRAAAGDKNAQNILAQAGWYKAMRARLRQEFGGLGDVFADLLGATSPNTPVRDNWFNAVDALRRASRGDYDTLLPQWVDWADKVDALEAEFRGWFNERMAEGLSKKAIKDLPEYKAKRDALAEARKLDDSLLPLKESGKKYGFNGRNVARAMVDLWRVVKNADPDIGRGGTAPKALNFSGNLIGFRSRATIDVWAARMLQRLAGGPRIPSMAETGVSGEMREDGTTTLQFGMGQDIFGEAAARIRADEELKTDKVLAEVNDDDLQAVVWFVEKELWTVNNWTSAAGEGGSFELEASLTGSAEQDRIKELRKVIDSSKSKPAAKAKAREELAALERSVDRFVGGLSIQMSAETQGVDFVPTDADMAQLAERVRLATYESDDGATVLASKVLSTEGRYGGVERSLDLEVVAREGYDPSALWAEMLRQAREARQDSTFLSRVLRDDEEVDLARHRPGVEIYFREAAAAEKLEQVLADLAKEGVEFLTVIVDGRRMPGAVAGEMPPAVGVRLQYVPEFDQRYGFDNLAGLDDVALAAKMQEKAREMKDLAARVAASVDGVAFAGQFWHETQVAFSHQYQEKLDALAAGNVEGGSGGTRSQAWAGEPVRAGLEGADRQARETASGEPDGGTDQAVAGDAPGSLTQEPQQPRGTFNPATLELVLNPNANLSTFFHETGHFFLEVLADVASQPNAPAQIVEDMNTFLKWAGIADLQTWNSLDLEGKRAAHERWAESIEQYVMEGRAPSVELQPLMRRFATWLKSVYGSIKRFLESRGQMAGGGEALNQMPAPEGVLAGPDGKPLLVYHGTNADVERFAGSDFPGWFSATTELAERYTREPNAWSAPNLMPAYLMMRNPLRIEGVDMNDSRDAALEFLTSIGFNADTTAYPSGPSAYRVLASAEFQTQLYDNGYDGVVVKEDGVDTFAPVFPNQIVSAISGEVLGQDPTAQPGPQMALNDDIRRVMDRMLATDEQIAQANEVAGLVPDLEADAAAAERLNKRSMADLKWQVRARDQAIAKLRKEAAAIEKDIRQQVTVEVDQTPEMRAKAALDALRVDPEHEALVKQHKAARKEAEAAARAEVKAALLADNPDAKGLIKGQLLAKNRRDIDNKVDAAMIKWDQANPAPARRFSPTDADAATIADSFGFEGVEAMLQAIDAFGPRADAIDGLTQQRMLEEHGDLIDDRAIQQAANEAVHNEARARSLATELRTQREMLNPRADTGETNAKGQKITVNALVEAAKQFAAKVVGGTSVADLRGKAWQHTAAERRASKRWTEATSAGKTEEAVKAKQDQMLNHAAAKAALDAQAEARKILDFFKRVAKGNDEKVVKGGRDADIVNAARAVLAAYGLETGTTKRAADYLETVKANDPDTYNAIAPMVDAAVQNAQPMAALTVDELRMLNEHIGALWYLAKRSRQSEVDGNLLDREDLADELFDRMQEIGIPDRVPGEGQAVTKAEERGLFLKQGIAFLRRVEQWAEGLDGKYGGPFLRYVFQPVKDAADRYRADRIAYRKKLQALVDNLAPVVGDSVIDAPELGYKFGTPGSTAGTAMNEILHAILHTGNPSNKRKLLLGRGWATEDAEGNVDTSRWDAFITRLANEGKLERAHYDFVQGVWDLLEDTKPLAQKAHRDVFGRYFDEVTAESFTDPWGQARRGGYVPAQVDSALVKDNALKKLAEEENASMAFAFPQPAKGFTMSRVEGYNRPLKLDLRTLSQHLDKVLLFSHMSAPVRDVRKLLTDKKVSQPLTRIQPAALESMLQPWLQRSAQQIVETPIVGSGKWARIPGLIRARAGAALMFANVSNSIQQITGLSTAAVRVKPAHLMRAAAQYVAHPVKFSQAVWGASPYMDDRAKNEVAVMNEQMQDILIRPGVYERAQNWGMRHAYFMQTAVDNVLSPIVWTGAFNQALAEGMSDSDAVKFADSTVRQTQGSTLPEDVSRFETGPAYARAFTQFVGYFNMMANTNGTALKQIADEVGLKKGAGRAFNVVMLGFMAPIWAAEAIAVAFRGGPDDEDDDGYLDDWLAAVFGFGTIKGLLAQIPVAGQFGVAAMNRFNGNPMDDRVSLSPAISLLESSVGAPESVYKAIVEDGSAQKAVRDVATLVSVATGVPVYGLARPVGYLSGIADDRIEPTGPVDFARGLITGTASPDSKQR